MKVDPDRQDEHRIVIGWREFVDLPEWGLFGIRAKADTGARSSAIDIDHLEELPGGKVRFQVVADRRGDGIRRTIEASLSRQSRVRSSLGDAYPRVFVETTVRLGGTVVRAEIGLVSRKNMISRMLLGRRFLEGIFLVDSGRRYIHRAEPPADGPPSKTD